MHPQALDDHKLMITRLSIFCFLFLSIFNTEESYSHTINETALEILKSGPGFQSDIYSLESAYTNLKTASNLPDPELGGEYLVMPADVDNRWTAEISWGLEWPGVYGARSKESKSKMSAAEKAVFAQRIEKLAEIKDLLLDYIQCRQKLELLDELNQNNDTIYQLAQKAVKSGEMTVLDLNKVKLEYANIRGAKAVLLDEEAELIGSLSQIYGKDCTHLLQSMECVFPVIHIPSEQEIAMIRQNAPTVKSALAEAEAVRHGRNVAKMEALPSLSVGYKHQYEDGMHFNGATLGISIPIFSSRGKQKAVKADIAEAEFKAQAAGQEVEAEAMATLKRLKLINRQIEEIAPIVEDVNYNKTLLKAYQGRLMTLLEYISDRNYFTNAAVELVSLRHTAAKAQAKLQKYLVTDSF